MSKKPYQNETVPIAEAARRVGTREQSLRMQMQQGKFPPGWAYQTEKGTWVYIIPRNRFEAWMNGTFIDIEALIKAIVDEINNRYRLQLRAS